MKKFFLVTIYLILSILGLVLMKLGENTGILGLGENNILTFSISLISLVGFVSYIISFLMFTNIVVKFDLSYIVPVTSGIVQVLTFVSGIIIFNENISITKITGAIIVIFGIIIMNIKKNTLIKSHERN